MLLERANKASNRCHFVDLVRHSCAWRAMMSNVILASKDTFYGQTPLSRAAEKGHEAVVKQLLAKNAANPDSKDHDGRTPLSWAAAKEQLSWMTNAKHEAVVELLLANNCVDMNTKDTGGRTPLSWAAGEGHYARVKLLLAKDGIDRDSKDDLDQTPLWWAIKNGLP
jgi:ankyrin repeat protein